MKFDISNMTQLMFDMAYDRNSRKSPCSKENFFEYAYEHDGIYCAQCGNVDFFSIEVLSNLNITFDSNGSVVVNIHEKDSSKYISSTLNAMLNERMFRCELCGHYEIRKHDEDFHVGEPDVSGVMYGREYTLNICKQCVLHKKSLKDNNRSKPDIYNKDTYDKNHCMDCSLRCSREYQHISVNDLFELVDTGGVNE